ncbi:HTH domain-containing protein [Peribacillus sp. FSL H8-0477]|uniref:HTH domain-containing protein n=1 Tax=Peribacillus sp. FSL H8-0477 TaxID=2921388 RepID=UPI0030F5E71E
MELVTLEENIAKLKNIYKMSDDLINKLLYTNEKTYPYHPIELSTLLTFVDINEEQRLCTIIEGLHRDIGLSYETLAAYCELTTEELEEFLRNQESLIDKKKFIIAVRIMFLHHILKEKYPTEGKIED